MRSARCLKLLISLVTIVARPALCGKVPTQQQLAKLDAQLLEAATVLLKRKLTETAAANSDLTGSGSRQESVFPGSSSSSEEPVPGPTKEAQTTALKSVAKDDVTTAAALAAQLRADATKGSNF